MKTEDVLNIDINLYILFPSLLGHHGMSLVSLDLVVKTLKDIKMTEYQKKRAFLNILLWKRYSLLKIFMFDILYVGA